LFTLVAGGALEGVLLIVITCCWRFNGNGEVIVADTCCTLFCGAALLTVEVEDGGTIGVAGGCCAGVTGVTLALTLLCRSSLAF